MIDPISSYAYVASFISGITVVDISLDFQGGISLFPDSLVGIEYLNGSYRKYCKSSKIFS